MSSIRDGATVDGQCEESIWPYSPLVPTPRPSEIPRVFSLARGRILGGIDADKLGTALREGHAVVLGLQVTESFQLAGSLPIDFVNESDPVLFNHAVLAVGMNDDKELAVVKNSWGISWGDAGYAPVTYRYLRRYGRLTLELEN